MTTILSTATGISQRTNTWAMRKMLRYAAHVSILDKFGKPYKMPKNKGVNLTWRRPVPFDAATTPLTEGVTPTPRAMEYENVPATLRQHGEVTKITDVIEDTHEDPVLQDIVELLGDNIGRTKEALLWAELRSGTNVMYANGASRAEVNTPLSINLQSKVIRALKNQKARKLREVLKPSPDYETYGIEDSFIAVAHTDNEADIRKLDGFTPVARYGTMTRICPQELGSVEEVRYVCSPDLDPYLDAGGAPGSTVKSNGGTQADVYPIIYLAKDAYSFVALAGEDALEPSIIPVNKKDKSDPLGQVGYAGWKTWFVAKILNDAWMVRLEVAASAL
ncbi:N4-gp56 family major capsid protein [Roseibium sp.]|uniref:N4-gp56 family major capsid protein n=1 Tax=Roseibium sp. TaxID=1936156 RepID=UPI003B5236E5